MSFSNLTINRKEKDMPEMKVYQREHFQRKISQLLQPEIQKEEMLISSTVADMVESAEKSLAKKIGADEVINNLKKAEEDLAKAKQKAQTFFSRIARKRVSYNKTLSYKFKGEQGYHYTDIKPSYCEEQIRTWATTLAEEEVKKRPEGKRLAYLKAVQTKAEDSIMEAHVSSDLTDVLSKILNNVGVSWDRPLPAIAPPSTNLEE